MQLEIGQPPIDADGLARDPALARLQQPADRRGDLRIFVFTLVFIAGMLLFVELAREE
jgi:hypothetical protein